MTRPESTSGAGTDFLIEGQDGYGNGAVGGNVVIRPGAGNRTGGTEGLVILADADGQPVVTVSQTLVTIDQPMIASGIDAVSSNITTSGDVTSG
eukprot:SAG31_NODE_21535_length_547_cov_0.685268_2_plen_93_part_01